MYIGSLKLKNSIFSAPMAVISDLPSWSRTGLL
jgi:hypothetical protein